MLRIKKEGIIAIFVVASLISGCGQEQLTVPITTKSDEAREAYVKGREYAENLRLAEARAYFEQAVKADPEFALAHLALAETQATTNEFYAAFNQAKACINRVSDGERLLILGTEAGIGGESRKWEQLLNELVTLYPRDKRAHLALGNFLFGQQLYQKAISEYRKIKALDPDFAPPYNQAGYSFRFLGKFKESENAFKTYIKLIPNDPNPYDSYAELLMKIGEFNESIESYKQALELDSSFAASYMGIAANLVHLDRHDAARVELQVMFNHAPDNGMKRNALAMKGFTWTDQGLFDKALEEFYRMLAIVEELGDSGTVANDLQLIARIHIEMKDWEAAQADLERFLNATEHSNLAEAAKKTNRRVYKYGQAIIANDRGDLTLADRLAQEYWQDVEKPGTRFQIMNGHALFGRIATARKDWTKAIEEFKQSNQRSPENLYLLARAYEENESLTRAKKTAKIVAEFNQTLTLSYTLVRKKGAKLYRSL